MAIVFLAKIPNIIFIFVLNIFIIYFENQFRLDFYRRKAYPLVDRLRGQNRYFQLDAYQMYN